MSKLEQLILKLFEKYPDHKWSAFGVAVELNYTESWTRKVLRKLVEKNIINRDVLFDPTIYWK